MAKTEDSESGLILLMIILFIFSIINIIIIPISFFTGVEILNKSQQKIISENYKSFVNKSKENMINLLKEFDVVLEKPVKDIDNGSLQEKYYLEFKDSEEVVQIIEIKVKDNIVKNAQVVFYRPISANDDYDYWNNRTFAGKIITNIYFKLSFLDGFIGRLILFGISIFYLIFVFKKANG